MRRIINSRTIEFKRITTEQELDENYELIDTSSDLTVKAKGSIQPYEEDNESGSFPEGKDATTAFLFYTKTLLKYAERRTQTLADTTTIRGRSYDVFPYEDWSVDFDVEAKGKAAYRTYLLIERTEDVT